MQQPVGSARAAARGLVANQLHRLDELTRELLSAPLAEPSCRIAEEPQRGLF